MDDPFFSPYDVIDGRDAEIARLKEALVEAEQRADDVARDKPIEEHGIDSCPTWHDRCHCNMETLRLYMEAMRVAESERDEARAVIAEIESGKCDSRIESSQGARNRGKCVIKHARARLTKAT